MIELTAKLRSGAGLHGDAICCRTENGSRPTPADGDLKSAKEGLAESFRWSNDTAYGEPVFVLPQDSSFTDDDAFVVVHRQFNLSDSDNAGQSVRALVPVTDGTVVL